MYIEEDYIQLSALSHYVFCPRRCGLIHVHGLWGENLFTARGRLMHERVDSNENETRGETHIVRSLNIYSHIYGLTGRADLVEFNNLGGVVVPYPVEYKSGKPKMDKCDTIQLCAQALCLEEMIGATIPEAALYYGKTRHRLKVELNNELRDSTIYIIRSVHEMVHTRSIPDGHYEKKCDSCSLREACMPKLGNKKVMQYLKELFDNHEIVQ